MKGYRVSFYFDTIEEADSEEQATEQAREYFYLTMGIEGIEKRASHFGCRADVITNRHTPFIMDKIIKNISK
jgi:hypothetical protein